MNLLQNNSLNGINCILDSYETDIVSHKLMEQLGNKAVEKLKSQQQSKTNIFSKIIKELQESLTREHVTLQRVFFDFDQRSDGCLTLDELHKMLNF